MFERFIKRHIEKAVNEYMETWFDKVLRDTLTDVNRDWEDKLKNQFEDSEIDYETLACEISYEELAENICYSDLNHYISADDVAAQIDLNDLAKEIEINPEDIHYESLAKEIDVDELDEQLKEKVLRDLTHMIRKALYV